ncbi:hypothetical protein [Streptomyces sp. NBC_00083]|uniref:hypothetical protein n=1 Tax=Streptomyces sp. NBC_00083 TaxID=2975647 RepID=UPI00225B96B8|nr:hypothetical protein [Streptomyces sp. NBC_00083]MCX5387733.1 hypothetical protein [Streptomyces sp. NBC_00083]
MPRTRAPRRRLTAVLLGVLGVLAVALCGPVQAASAAPAAPVSALTRTSAASPAADASDRGTPPVFRDHSGPPGCKQGGRHQDSDPAAPVRVRTAHEQAPVLEDRVAPAALGALYAAHRNPPVRGPAPGAPTPVELSVLRV